MKVNFSKLKKCVLIIFSIFLSFNLFATSKQGSQIIPVGHWIYDDLTVLSAESKNIMFLETQPLSVGEIRLNLRYIDYETLSDAGKLVYDRVTKYLDDEDDFFKNSSLRVFLNVRANPEFMYKSNPNINWSFYPKINFMENPITFPVIIGFSDYFTIQSDLTVGRSASEALKPDNFMNIPFNLGGYDMYVPTFAYFSGTKVFDDWGLSAHMGKQGMKIGNTSLGSILYNDTFISDFYFQFNLFAKYLRFSMDVVQFSASKYMFLHHLTLRPFKNFYISVLEGSLITAPFELRFLNPLMIMHQFEGWRDNDPTQNQALNYVYGESNFCAYLGFTFEYMPIRNLRIYGLYAQNEILDFGDPRTPENLSMPDSIGGQLGVEYFIPLENQSHVKTRVEAVYTSPYLYVKQSPIWSLIRTFRAGSHSVQSWLGSPLGPDSFILQANAEYNSNKKWAAGLGYEFTIHGENTPENLFNKEKYYKKTIIKDGVEVPFWDYYPAVQYEQEAHQDDKDAAVARARYMWMTGTPEYKNQISLYGHYNILENLILTGQFAYTFVFNNKNKINDFQQGVELEFVVTYELF